MIVIEQDMREEKRTGLPLAWPFLPMTVTGAYLMHRAPYGNLTQCYIYSSL